MNKIFESKNKFHKDRARLSFEEKFEIVIKLQKIDFEFSKYRKNKKQLKPWNKKEIGLN